MTEEPGPTGLAMDEENERRRAYHREYYQRNKEKIRKRQLAYSRRYYSANKEKILSKYKDEKRWREDYKKNPEGYLRRIRKYRSRLSNEQRSAIRARERLQDRIAGRNGASKSRNRLGFTPELIEKCRELQQNACAICRRPFTEVGKHRACADHCHDSGIPRGLLCFTCNITEGKIRDTGLTPIEFGQRLHDYLANPPAST